MLSQLYPPHLDGTIPSFYNNNGTVKIAVPFTHNRTVGTDSISGYCLKIKNILSSSYITTLQIDKLDNENGILYFTLEDTSLLKEKMYYKFQLAYKANETVGYYSTVATGKFTYKPEVTIDGLTQNSINMNSYDYVGRYENEDTTEKVYNYYFTVYDNKGNIVNKTDTLLHNTSTDDISGLSYDLFTLAEDLDIDVSYYLVYTIITNNGLEISSPKYRIMQKVSVDPEIKTEVKATLDYDNGYIDVSLIGELDEDGMETPTSGAFLLTRACESTGYKVWDEISRFKLYAQNPSRYLWRDYTVEQGKHYKYALLQYNDSGLYSNKIISNIIYADFEDAFLFDGEKLLKLKYNPKISTFKTTILETKLDTIGSQHPFIFRNGRTNYKEFLISGLISYLMDDENLFVDAEDIMLSENTTNLTSENISSERQFKLKVLDWLNNGKEKVFRSPSEGNYIIRLMNVSLTPTDMLGRMLHTFNATAYEMAEYTYENLNSFDFILLENPNQLTMKWKTLELSNYTVTDSTSGTYIVEDDLIYNIQISGAIPGTKFKFTYLNDGTLSTEDETLEIIIGVTGGYSISVDTPITDIQLLSLSTQLGNLTYGFKNNYTNVFNKIDSVEVTEIPIKLFMGEHNILEEITCVYDSENEEWVDNPKTELINIINLNVALRDTYDLYYKEEENNRVYYKDKNFNNVFTVSTDIDEFTLYRIYEGKLQDKTSTITDATELGRNLIYTYECKGYAEGKNLKSSAKVIYNYSADDYDSCLYFDDELIDLSQIKYYSFRLNQIPKTLKIGCGVNAEIAYLIRTITYLIETYNETVKSKKEIYLANLESYNNITSAMDNYTSEALITSAINNLNEIISNDSILYTDFILTLISALQEENELEET